MTTDAEASAYERQTRQALFMLIAAIAQAYGPAMAARIVKGLYEKYAEMEPQAN